MVIVTAASVDSLHGQRHCFHFKERFVFIFEKTNDKLLFVVLSSSIILIMDTHLLNIVASLCSSVAY